MDFHEFSWIVMDSHGFTFIFMNFRVFLWIREGSGARDFRRFAWILIVFYGFSLILMVLVSECRQPVGILKTLVAACGVGSDPPKNSDSRVWGAGSGRLDAWMLDAGRIGMDWRR